MGGPWARAAAPGRARVLVVTSLGDAPSFWPWRGARGGRLGWAGPARVLIGRWGCHSGVCPVPGPPPSRGRTERRCRGCVGPTTSPAPPLCREGEETCLSVSRRGWACVGARPLRRDGGRRSCTASPGPPAPRSRGPRCLPLRCPLCRLCQPRAPRPCPRPAGSLSPHLFLPQLTGWGLRSGLDTTCVTAGGGGGWGERGAGQAAGVLENSGSFSGVSADRVSTLQGTTQVAAGATSPQENLQLGESGSRERAQATHSSRGGEPGGTWQGLCRRGGGSGAKQLTPGRVVYRL